AKNLCDFAFKGPDCGVQPDVARLIREIVAAKKPLAAVCIAPALVAKVLGEDNLDPQLTIGTDEETAGAVSSMGATHLSCPVQEFVVDKKNKVITSPAYMLAGSISEAAEGIEKTVKELMKMID
ncbi:MAG: isoprenoid biosynthesis protein ElbB, partial [Deltaproteobacteria bacterium]